ncbi:hypothetical protein Angca_000735, partial [Angiostrongylus cantonensis]
YPQEGNELGAPVLREPDDLLSHGTTFTRIFHLYIYSTANSVLSDIALLEMVDPSRTSANDRKNLFSNGFLHEIDANGKIYWARGSIFKEINLQSKCIIRAAVAVRMLATNPSVHYRETIGCPHAMTKWLNIMGLEKNGFK